MIDPIRPDPVVREHQKTPAGERKRPERIRLLWPFIAGGVFAVAVIVFLAVYFSANRTKDPVDSYADAVEYCNTGRYDEAIPILLTLNAGEGRTHESVVLLAKCYQTKNQYDDCIAVLQSDQNTYSDTEMLSMLLDCYIAKDDTEAIAKCLSKTNNEEILQKYDEYIAPVPLFSLESGT